MIYLIFVIFGLLPSVIWLLFYLRKDAHPESKKMVLKIFFYGMIGGLIAMIIELWLIWSIMFFAGGYISSIPILFFLLNQFVIIALVEELSKLLIVKGRVVNDKEFDEPVDTMLYMIIVALGFATLENFLVLFSLEEPFLIRDIAMVSSFRFLGATFLHALASGVIGYYLALAFYYPKRKIGLVIKGIISASIIHGLFNISIGMIEKGLVGQKSFLFAMSFGSLIILLAGNPL